MTAETPEKGATALVGPHLVEVQTLELTVRMARDHGIDYLTVVDVMFRTVLERVVVALGPETAARYLRQNADLVERAARSIDSNGLSEMPAQGEA
ncbi:MAG: hypothetical protein Q7J44_11580 [Pseudotabrizicola sp.]|uniref:hypothetical protein n=1 Tax=Pseudotabrizicola sp. TaxID=2939647 RepID=UPI00272810CC|nr:hypothetical protein [Pseudotabrizicola sp.]MDO9639171.1 hypothetical protein [Pseudotabrizicola sp.]